eukprot:6851344-Prymnesium_polylepis.1
MSRRAAAAGGRAGGGGRPSHPRVVRSLERAERILSDEAAPLAPHIERGARRIDRRVRIAHHPLRLLAHRDAAAGPVNVDARQRVDVEVRSRVEHADEAAARADDRVELRRQPVEVVHHAAPARRAPAVDEHRRLAAHAAPRKVVVERERRQQRLDDAPAAKVPADRRVVAVAVAEVRVRRAVAQQHHVGLCESRADRIEDRTRFGVVRHRVPATAAAPAREEGGVVTTTQGERSAARQREATQEAQRERAARNGRREQWSDFLSRRPSLDGGVGAPHGGRRAVARVGPLEAGCVVKAPPAALLLHDPDVPGFVAGRRRKVVCGGRAVVADGPRVDR